MLATWAKHLLYLQSWTNILEHICFCGALFKSYMTNLPPPLPEPQTRLDGCIQNFSQISTLFRVGGGRTTRCFWKIALFYDSTCKLQKIISTALLSQGLFSWIVDSATAESFMSEKRYIFIHFFLLFFYHQNSALRECSLTIIGSQCDWGCESES